MTGNLIDPKTVRVSHFFFLFPIHNGEGATLFFFVFSEVLHFFGAFLRHVLLNPPKTDLFKKKKLAWIG